MASTITLTSDYANVPSMLAFMLGLLGPILTTQGVEEMKRILFVLCLILSLAAAIPASADTLGILGISDINSLVYGTTQYGNEYVGPIGSALNNTPITGGITCLDINTQTYVPTSFDVYVGSLSPVDLSHAKFATQPDDLFHYQEAAALLGQMASHPTQIGEIQFAIWRIFDPSATSGESVANVTIEDSWLTWAAGINVNSYDFSSVRIYTATNTNNQEFMSGAAVDPVPVPPTVFLMGSGLLGLGLLSWRRKRGC